MSGCSSQTEKISAENVEYNSPHPEQEVIMENIGGARRVVLEVYANEPEKRKKRLKAIDDKIPDIMNKKSHAFL